MRATIKAEPEAVTLNLARTALLIIDMQRDFLEPGGFGEMLGNDVSQLRRTIEPNKALLAAWRGGGPAVIHTREGHRPISATSAGQEESRPRRACASATPGRWAASSIRGEPGHDIIPELYPRCRRTGHRQAGQRRVFRHRPSRHPAELGITAARRHRRHHRSLRATPRSAKPTTAATTASSPPTAGLLLPRVPGNGPEDDQGAGRHLRLGRRTAERAARRTRPPALLTTSDRGRIMTTTTSTAQTENLGARRLERLLRLRHQHPRQPAHAHRAAAVRAEDAGRPRLRPNPARASG